MTENFVHLHVHTEYSLLDGAIRIPALLDRAEEWDMPAVAITDHGVLYGIIDFYRQARKRGITPIIGCEVYVTPSSRHKKDTSRRYHLVLLAMNKEGYHNLIKLVTTSWLEGFYYKPRVDKELLNQHSRGLVALSACLQGEIPSLILQGSKDKAVEAIEEYRQIFGKDNFFLELQDHNLADEKKVNSSLIKLASAHDYPLVVTNDAHYYNQDDADLHDILLALQTGKTVDDEDRMRFPNDQFYLKDPGEMRSLFPEIESACSNTVEIASRVELELDFDSFYLPDYPGTDQDQEQLLRQLCEKGLKEKGLEGNKEARERLEYELGIIEEMGYVSYFLIVQDFVNYAEKHDIRVGPGRGSAAGSLVSYLLGITRINPLQYGLIFERFLNPQRVTMPDIDIDFDERRDEIIKYVKERYGEDRVAQIGTFGTMAARAAVRDVGRVLNVPYKKVDRLAKMIPATHGITIDRALEENKDLTRLYEEDETARRIIEFSRGIEGMPRHISTHAAGVIIGPEKLSNIIPLQFQDESIITQLPMDELEALGLLKMDFLGLRNLTVIGKTLELIKKKRGIEIDLENIPRDDEEVYRMLGEGQTLGVFQMESYLFQDLNRRLKPDRFEDLIALLALGRPGPLGSNLVDDYIRARHGEKEPEYLHSSLEPILAETFGLILYQEQVMEIAGKLGGFSMGEADILRRGMGKKKQKLVARERERFVRGAEKNGIETETANEIFDQMEYFSGYGFNKSHSAAYALLAYQTAYLKVKYPSEFMAALLSSVMNNLDKVGLYIQEAKEMGIEVLPPDVNESGYEFETNASGNIRFGLKAIKNVGKNAIRSIIKARQSQPYTGLEDFLQRIDPGKVNIKVVESLVKSGAMDGFEQHRSQLLLRYEDLYQKINAGRKEHSKGQRSFFDLFEEKKEFYNSEIEYPDVDELDFGEKLSLEKEYLGIYISGHPLDRWEVKIKSLTNINCQQLSEIEEMHQAALAAVIVDYKLHVTRNEKQMAFLTVEDRAASTDIVVFPDLFNNLDFELETGKEVLITGRYEDDSFIAGSILPLEREFISINIDPHNRKKLNQLSQIMSRNNGYKPVIINIGEDFILTAKKYWLSDEGMTAIIDIMGEKNIVHYQD